MPILDFHEQQPVPPTDPRLGRLIDFDARSANFPIRTLISPTAKLRSYSWSCLTEINQGRNGTCVGHGIAHEIAAKPVVRPADEVLALQIYDLATELDPWPNNNHDRSTGTSVLAGMQAATQLGHYKEYRWAFGVEDLCLALGYKGPAVLGIHWYDSMFTPDVDGLINISGNVAGGHCLLTNQIKCVWSSTLPIAQRSFANLDMDRSLARLHNSWGTGWGKNGDCFISLHNLDRLLQEQGEACIPVQRL